jgi:hypothetical protein
MGKTAIAPELAEARSQADAMGIKYHHRAKASTINRLIAESAGHTAPKPVAPVREGGPRFGRGAVMTAAEYKDQEAKKRIRNAGALVRVQVTCMDPGKKNWDGEFISVGSAKMGTFKKFVPYNGLPYHLPRAILDEMKTRKCTVFINEKRGGETFKKGKLIDKYSIQELPPLTSEELEELARQQKLADNGL